MIHAPFFSDPVGKPFSMPQAALEAMRAATLRRIAGIPDPQSSARFNSNRGPLTIDQAEAILRNMDQRRAALDRRPASPRTLTEEARLNSMDVRNGIRPIPAERLVHVRFPRSG